MLESNIFALISSTAVVIATWLIIHFTVARPIQKDKQRWAFYAIRDKLIALVRDDQLKADSLIFNLFYQQVNQIIIDIDKVTFSNFVRNIRRTNEETLSNIKTITKELSKSDPEVQRVIHDYFKVIAYVLVDNSILLKVIILMVDFLPHKSQKLKASELPIKREIVKTWWDTRRLEARFA